MPDPSSSASVRPADWNAVLENIEHALTRAMTEAMAREQALASGPSGEAPAAETPAFEGERNNLEQRLRDLRACYQQAEQDAAAVDALLQSGEDSIRTWLTAAAALRQRLATWSTASLS
jgi:hypothetical protein